MYDVLHPDEVGVAHGRGSELPALVLAQALAAPLLHVERWVRQDEVRLEVREPVVVEGVALLDPPFDAADREVHLGKAPGGVVQFLPIDPDLAASAAPVAVARGVGLDELDGLDEHASRAAAGVVHAALEGLEHFDEQADHAPGRVELAALLALGAGELAEDVFGPGLGVAHSDVAHEVDELSQALPVQGRAGVVLREHS